MNFRIQLQKKAKYKKKFDKRIIMIPFYYVCIYLQHVKHHLDTLAGLLQCPAKVQHLDENFKQTQLHLILLFGDTNQAPRCRLHNLLGHEFDELG